MNTVIPSEVEAATQRTKSGEARLSIPLRKRKAGSAGSLDSASLRSG
jgi:hypothetical protein